MCILSYPGTLLAYMLLTYGGMDIVGSTESLYSTIRQSFQHERLAIAKTTA